MNSSDLKFALNRENKQCIKTKTFFCNLERFTFLFRKNFAEIYFKMLLPFMFVVVVGGCLFVCCFFFVCFLFCFFFACLISCFGFGFVGGGFCFVFVFVFCFLFIFFFNAIIRDPTTQSCISPVGWGCRIYRLHLCKGS